MSVNLKIEEGIGYIPSQNLFECIFDAMQIIFLYADGFRPIFAGAAEELSEDELEQWPRVEVHVAAPQRDADARCNGVTFNK